MLAAASALIATTTAIDPSAASAQTEQLDEAARLTFESAREAFVNGQYEIALQRFRQAYQLSPRPGLLYNIAQTLDRLRRDRETLAALRQYLEAAPDAPNRAEVEARIRVLEQAIPRDGEQHPNPHGGSPATTTPEGNALAILHPAFFIAAGGLTLAGAGVLIWSGVETLSLNDAYNETTNYDAAFAAYNRALDQQTLTNVFIGVTAGLGVAAAALAVITDWNAFGGGGTARVSPLLWAGPDGAWLGLGARF